MRAFTGVVLLMLLVAFGVYAQSDEALADLIAQEKASATADVSPTVTSTTPSNITDAPFDLQFWFDVQAATGALGNAGAEYDGTELFTTRWASNLIHRFDLSGNLLEEFSITGVTNLRDLAFDGTHMYGGQAQNFIYEMDFTSKTLIGTINTPVAVRHIAYDAGVDGFWVGNWNTDIVLVDRAGNVLNTIPAATHGLAAMYGSAYDPYTSGGPYLWVFDQGMGAGSPQLIHQFDLATGTPTGVTYDVAQDFPTANGIAGGLFVGENYVPGFASIGGLLQGTPDIYFMYELAPLADPDDPNPPTNFTAYSDYSMPTSMLLTWTDPTSLVNGTPIGPADFVIDVYRDGALVTSVAGGTETYTDTGLNDGQLYNYDIVARLVANDSTSAPVSASWIAGGSPIPDPPTNLFITTSGSDLMMHWTNPSTNIDGTPMDDFAAINLYEDGTLVATFTRSPADTGAADSALYTPPAGTHSYYVTAVDNEAPPNESDPSNVAFPPLSLPFFDDFEAPTGGVPNPAFWVNDDAEVNSTIPVNPPSPVNAMVLDGFPHSSPEVGDMVTLLPVDLSGMQGSGVVFAYWYQPQGNGNAPETGDSLAVDFLNSLGQWRTVRAYPGTPVVPFAQEVIDIASLDPGPGATYFFNGFQVRFRNRATVSTTTPFDHWSIDDVFLGVPTADPVMVVDPLALIDTLLVNGSGTLNFMVSNTNTQPSTLNYTITEDPPVTWLDVTPTSGTLTSGQTDVIDVNLDATGLAAGTYNTSLIVAGNDPANPSDTVDVTLVVNDAPIVAFSPDSMNFTLDPGMQDSAVMTIFNLGAGPLNFTLTDEDVVVAKVIRRPKRQVERQTPIYPSVDVAKGEADPRPGIAPQEGLGGPDAFGYRWIDSDEPGGPTFNWIDISGVGTGVSLGDDDFVEVTLPFTFNFYGVDHTMIKISSNGYLTFGPDGTDFSNDPIPDPNDPNDLIAPFWDDLNPSQGGMIYYYSPDPSTFIVQWDAVPHFGSGGPYTFEAILKSNGQMLFQYLDMNSPLESATIGIENVDASIGLQVVYNAPYMHNNLAIRIAADSPWLSENPTSGTILPGDSMDIMIIADATGLLGGDYFANVIIESNDPVHPDTSMPVHLFVTGVPDIDATPNPLIFPDPVFVNDSTTEMLYVKNLGNIDLHVTDITSNNPAFSVDMTQFSVPPFDSVCVTVTFAPTSVGTITGSLTIVSDDPDEPNFPVSVQGEGIAAPVIDVFPDSLEAFVPLGDSLDTTLVISNLGGSDLTYTASASQEPVALRLLKLKPGVGVVTRASSMERGPAPTRDKPRIRTVIDAPFDLLFSFDVQAASGALGNAGSEHLGGEYFTTRWASNLIHRYDLTGALLEEFSITGVTNLRDLASDGTYMYGGQAQNFIYQMDFTSKTLIGTINTPVPVRHIAYDEGADGFWVGNWNTDIVLVDRNGTVLNTIPAANHGLAAMYGSAYDRWTAGGPYLWVFDQGQGAGFPQFIHQIDLASGMPTGFVYDVAQDFPAANGIAGGLFTEENLYPGLATIGGLLQGTPDMFFVYELAEAGPVWLTLLEPTSGTIAPGDVAGLTARLFGLSDSTYHGAIIIESNDPVNSTVVVPVWMSITGIGDEEVVPTEFAVSRNYPNPFNPTTRIDYELPKAEKVSLVIYNLLGQKVRTLVNGRQQAGRYHVVWDGRSDAGVPVASGVYIYRFQAGDFVRTYKMVLLK